MEDQTVQVVRRSNILGRAVEAMASITELLATIALGCVLMLLFVAVTLRNGFGVAYGWLDDLLRYGMIWMVYLSLMRLSMTNNHINVDLFINRMPPRLQRPVQVLLALLAIVLCIYVTYLGYLMSQQVITFGQRSNSGTLPAYLGYGIIPVSFLLSAIAYIYYLFSGGARSDQTK